LAGQENIVVGDGSLYESEWTKRWEKGGDLMHFACAIKLFAANTIIIMDV
jgi:hypothetical protein